MMVNVSNQRSGDEWIVGGERVVVTGSVMETDAWEQMIPVRVVASGANRVIRIRVEAVPDWARSE